MEYLKSGQFCKITISVYSYRLDENKYFSDIMEQVNNTLKVLR